MKAVLARAANWLKFMSKEDLEMSEKDLKKKYGLPVTSFYDPRFDGKRVRTLNKWSKSRRLIVGYDDIQNITREAWRRPDSERFPVK